MHGSCQLRERVAAYLVEASSAFGLTARECSYHIYNDAILVLRGH